ncbi:carbamoyltransferase N-terminal domain-containing protein [Gaetbulibacter jejuensis]|uniref:Carbamoyltransferase N-terminal domain-containing protein n=1 Tax=Gaetbulibacter jejuensis TaxID=584607 RepID=A0ABN1JIC7_9FLAO
MITTCGIKLTHDGAVALFEDNKLIFSVEMEKINNNARFSNITDLKSIEDILKTFGYNLKDVDKFVIDGWGNNEQDILDFYPGLSIKDGVSHLKVSQNGESYQLPVASYLEDKVVNNTLTPLSFDGLKISGQTMSYDSYLHTTGHIMGSYMTSPFAVNNESSFFLVWDGGMYPHFYYLDAATRKITNLGVFFNLLGSIYSQFAQYFEPFKKGKNTRRDLALAGKVMAYIAFGEPQKKLFPLFEESLEKCNNKSIGLSNAFADHFESIVGEEFKAPDVLYSFHVFLREKLLEHLELAIKKSGIKNRNLCFSGGCALNIKWNSDIRRSGLFDNVYVPPFPNDSGSAIGTACSSIFVDQGYNYIDWSVYAGPDIIVNDPGEGWQKRECTVVELAKLLHTSNEPVVLLNSRAEIGPRALGNRSIIASPVSTKLKDILNNVKDREAYRPVSPICKEESAPEIFEPGTTDPYMLFDHIVKKEWIEKIPAVIHIDNTARLQTVNKKDNKLVYELLNEFEKLSSIPLLCNTSANYKGTGFFPDIHSATKWNKVNYVWCNNTIYEKSEKIKFN